MLHSSEGFVLASRGSYTLNVGITSVVHVVPTIMVYYLSNGDLLVQTWIDRKEVYFLSTIHRAQYSVEVPETDHTVCRQSAPGAIDVPATFTDYVGYQDTLHLNPYLLWLTVFAIMPKRQTGMLSFRIFSSWPT